MHQSFVLSQRFGKFFSRVLCKILAQTAKSLCIALMRLFKSIDEVDCLKNREKGTRVDAINVHKLLI